MNIHREVGSLLSSVTKSHSSYHIALGCDAHTRAASHTALLLDLLPQVILSTLHFRVLRVVIHLVHNLVNLLQFQVHDIVHQALSHGHMLAEQLIVEVRILRKRIHHIRVEVDAEQAA